MALVDPDQTRRYLALTDLGLARPSKDDVRSMVRQWRAEALLLVVAGLDLELSQPLGDRAAESSMQQRLAQQICPPQLSGRIVPLLRAGDFDAWVNPPQVHLLARLAIQYGQPGAGDLTSATTSNLGILLLALNCNLSPESERMDTAETILLRLTLRQLGMLRSEQARYQVARYFDLLVTRQRPSTKGNLDLEGPFRAETGVSIDEFMALAFVYWAACQNASPERGADVISLMRSLESQIADARLREAGPRLLSRTVAQLRIAYESAGDDWSISPIRPLQDTPIVTFADGARVPLSQRFLSERASTGPYWTLHRRFSMDDPEHGVARFNGHMGTTFEAYLTELLQRTFAREPGGARFVPERTIWKASPGRKKWPNPPFDGAVIDGSRLVLLEMTVTGPAVTAMVDADFGAFRKSVNQSLRAKIRRLRAAIDGLADGTWVIPTLDLSTVRTIVPVLAVLHPYPLSVPTLQPLSDALIGDVSLLAPGGSVLLHPFGQTTDATRILPLQVVSAEDFEMAEPLVALGHLGLGEVLGRKADRTETLAQNLKTYLLLREGVQELDNSHMLTLFRRATASFTTILNRSLGASG